MEKRHSVFDEPALLAAMQRRRINAKHRQTLLRHIVQQQYTTVREFQSIRSLPKDFIALVAAEFATATSKIVTTTEAKDGSTTKLLIQLQSGQTIESVIMRYGDVEFDSFPSTIQLGSSNGAFKSRKRATLCVSSQVGCAMGCTFCATGTMGLLGNLTAGEILEQLYLALQLEPAITNVVFMGMGEPLDNYRQVVLSIKSMIDTAMFALSPAKITVSTVPRIVQMMKDMPQVSLALIVPSGKAYPIAKIMQAVGAGNGKALVEYVLIESVNDSESTATELAQLLQHRDVILNLIPYNPTAVPFAYNAPSKPAQDRFAEITRSYGVKTILRQTLGGDVSSACGQLVIANSKVGGGGKNMNDIEDLTLLQKKHHNSSSGNDNSRLPLLHFAWMLLVCGVLFKSGR